MKKLLIFLPMLALIFGCEKGIDQKKVTYLVTDSEAGYALTYTDENGSKIKQDVAVASQDDKWKLSFLADPGSIVYLSVVDTTMNSFVKVIIYVNGKVYKQGVRSEDVTKPVTVSGTVPFN